MNQSSLDRYDDTEATINYVELIHKVFLESKNPSRNTDIKITIPQDNIFTIFGLIAIQHDGLDGVTIPLTKDGKKTELHLGKHPLLPNKIIIAYNSQKNLVYFICEITSNTSVIVTNSNKSPHDAFEIFHNVLAPHLKLDCLPINIQSKDFNSSFLKTLQESIHRVYDRWDFWHKSLSTVATKSLVNAYVNTSTTSSEANFLPKSKTDEIQFFISNLIKNSTLSITEKTYQTLNFILNLYFPHTTLDPNESHIPSSQPNFNRAQKIASKTAEEKFNANNSNYFDVFLPAGFPLDLPWIITQYHHALNFIKENSTPTPTAPAPAPRPAAAPAPAPKPATAPAPRPAAAPAPASRPATAPAPASRPATAPAPTPAPRPHPECFHSLHDLTNEKIKKITVRQFRSILKGLNFTLTNSSSGHLKYKGSILGQDLSIVFGTSKDVDLEPLLKDILKTKIVESHPHKLSKEIRAYIACNILKKLGYTLSIEAERILTQIATAITIEASTPKHPPSAR